ncbi:hypothetical protein C8R42DRAFT_727936 [Lentinula raphanica]|nr:hypothetical protein C8R42DRAFT_727936 [Lentinula raphanica]
MARTYPPGYYGPFANPGWGSYSHTPGQVMPNTYVPYPHQPAVPAPALADGLGWQWQPPPPPPPLPNHHYSPTTSVLTRHGHNSFPQRLIDTTGTPVSQLRVQSSSIHQRPVYVPSVEVMTTIALPPSRYTSTVPVPQPPAKPRTLKTGVTSAKVSPPSSRPRTHTSMPAQSVESKADRTILTTQSPSISPPKPSAPSVKVEHSRSAVLTHVPQSPPVSASVTENMSDDLVQLLGARCRHFALSIGSRDHSNRSPEEWISLVSQLDIIRPLFFQDALRQNHVQLEFAQITQQTLALHSKQSTLHQSALPSAASSVGIHNVGDPSVPAATIKSNTGQRSELVPQYVSELEKPSMTCAKPRADNSDLAQAGVSKTSQLETSKFSWSHVGNWAAPTVASPKVTDHDIEVNRSGSRDYRQPLNGKDHWNLATANGISLAPGSKSDYRYANQAMMRNLVNNNGMGLIQDSGGYCESSNVPVAPIPQQAPVGLLPPPEPPLSLASSVSLSAESLNQSASPCSPHPHPGSYHWSSFTSLNRSIHNMLSTAVDLQEDSDTDDDDNESTSSRIEEVDDHIENDEDDSLIEPDGQLSDQLCIESEGQFTENTYLCDDCALEEEIFGRNENMEDFGLYNQECEEDREKQPDQEYSEDAGYDTDPASIPRPWNPRDNTKDLKRRRKACRDDEGHISRVGGARRHDLPTITIIRPSSTRVDVIWLYPRIPRIQPLNKPSAPLVSCSVPRSRYANNLDLASSFFRSALPHHDSVVLNWYMPRLVIPDDNTTYDTPFCAV